jgi:ATP-dependent DNA helicase RecG
MKNEKVSDLAQRGESQTLEFKKSLACLREGLQALCGMVNADAAEGAIVFGVDPNAGVVGVEPGNLDKAERSISQKIGSKFQPELRFVIETKEMNQKRILVLKAERSRDVPYHEFDGRAFIREGTVTRQLSLAEKQSLQRTRRRDLHPGPWRCNRCGFSVGTFSSCELRNQGIRKVYSCPRCGGELWPAT